MSYIDRETLYSLLLEAWNSGEIESPPRSYSGRGMFGRRCIAVKTNGDVAKVAFAVGQLAGLGGHEERLPRTNVDSLGLGSIVYWPSCEWDDNVMEEQD